MQVGLTAGFAALPVESARVALALTHAIGDSLGTWTGALDTDGAPRPPVPPAAPATPASAPPEDEGFAFSVVRGGADAARATGAGLSLTETGVGDGERLAVDAVSDGLRWGHLGGSEVVDVPLVVGGLGWVWGAALPRAFAPGDKPKIKLEDADGGELDKVSVALSAPIDGGAGGIHASSVDEDPETTGSLLPVGGGGTWTLGAHSHECSGGGP